MFCVRLREQSRLESAGRSRNGSKLTRPAWLAVWQDFPAKFEQVSELVRRAMQEIDWRVSADLADGGQDDDDEVEEIKNDERRII